MLNRILLAGLTATVVIAGCDAQIRQEAPLPASPEQAAPAQPEGAADGGAKKEFTTTESGLKYRILREGSSRKPVPTDMVQVDYKGWLDNGDEFDSSYKSGMPAEFELNGVIPGWTEGLQLIGEGGKIELEIPAKLAYKGQSKPARPGFSGIPANSTLHFEVELLKIL